MKGKNLKSEVGCTAVDSRLFLPETIIMQSYAHFEGYTLCIIEFFVFVR